MTAAVLADGETTISNAAKEPEIVDLADFLNAMGAKVSGQGTSTIRIEGVSSLNGCTHQPIGDRIEAFATFLLTGLLTNSTLKVTNFRTEHLSSVFSIQKKNWFKYFNRKIMQQFTQALCGSESDDNVFPGFPTDIQAQLMTLMCSAEGVSVITENIFENRFIRSQS